MRQVKLKKRVGVIGAGVAGLASAIRLARMGFLVDVYEQAPRAGGKLSEFNADGFRFDMGPSLFTLPDLLEELLDEDFALESEKLEVITRYFYEDGTRINAFAELDRFADEVERKTKDSGESVRLYLAKAALIYDLTAPIFIFNSFHRLSRLLTWSNVWRAMQLPRIQALRSLHRKNQRSFRDARLVQLFDRFATYNGSNPYVAPATLQVIAHLEHNIGAFFPEGGMYRIVEKLQAQAAKLGVRFHWNTPVEKVVANKLGEKELWIKGEKKLFDLLINDVDVGYFYEKLLDKPGRLKSCQPGEASSSAIIFYWGISKEFQQLDLHNIFFSKDYKAEFDALFVDKTLLDDPTIYVYVSSKKCKNDAPEGMENWFVMVNAPADDGQDWNELRKTARKAILEKLRRMLGEEIEKYIVMERNLDPPGLEFRTSSVGGAIYGDSSNSLFSAFRRHPNYRKDLPGIYFVGGSVHPGGGIPLCLSSAKIVSELIEEQEVGQ